MDTFKFGWRIQNAIFTNIPVSNIIWQWISIQPNEVVIVTEIMKSNPGPPVHRTEKNLNNIKNIMTKMFVLRSLINLSHKTPKIFTHTCSCSVASLSGVSRTASLCPRASHMDLAVFQFTFSSCRVKLIIKPLTLHLRHKQGMSQIQNQYQSMCIFFSFWDRAVHKNWDDDEKQKWIKWRWKNFFEVLTWIANG